MKLCSNRNIVTVSAMEWRGECMADGVYFVNRDYLFISFFAFLTHIFQIKYYSCCLSNDVRLALHCTLRENLTT